MTKNFKWWPVIGLTIASSAALLGCGGNSSSGDTSVRVLNATLTHPSIDLLVNAAASIAAVKSDTVSAYVTPGSGSVVLQVNDSSTGAALTTLSPTIASGAHDTLVVYEGGSGVIRTALMPEDNAFPASGAAAMNVLDAAIDAGALDVYVTAVGQTPAAAPLFTLSAQTFIQFPGAIGLPPGNYQILVTAQGNKTDVRAVIPSVALASQQLGLLVLTPASGGILLNAGVSLQQVATTYTAQRNTNARVRLVSGVFDAAAAVSAGATAGSVTLAADAPSPSINSYVTVPATSTLAVTVDGAAVTPPAASIAAGGDYTIFLTGTPEAGTTATLITDDNHVPTTVTSNTSPATTSKFRLINGLSGPTASAATLSVNSSFLPAVAPGSASGYSALAISASQATETDVNFAASPPASYARSGTLAQNSVYTVFVLGNPATAVPQLRLDR